MSASDFTQLKIWQRSIQLVRKIYKFTKDFPKEELYGLSSQLRRAAVSIPSNIAEGSQRHSQKDFANFIGISKGSLAELETQCIIAQELGYAKSETIVGLRKEIQEISKMLYSFRSKLITHTS